MTSRTTPKGETENMGDGEGERGGEVTGLHENI